jgi:bifunctional enzyme CysN/CysC
LRAGLNGDLGFSDDDRSENIRRLASIGSHLSKSGCIAIIAAVAPYTANRELARAIVDENFVEVHVATSLAVCEARDPKGHYAKARAGLLPEFTGINNSYQIPSTPDIVVDCGVLTIEDAVNIIAVALHKSGIL